MDYARDEFVDDPREEIVETISTEMNEIKRKLGEIKTQIDQTQLMVDREQTRTTDLATELQNINNNLDTVPREDIRDKYNEAMDARFRLATMRGQLEKFESNYESMEREQQLLSMLLSKLQGIDVIPDFDDIGGSGDMSNTIVSMVRIVEAQEDERQRLAHQMHDGPAQSLTNFILQAEICQRLFNRNPERAEEELNNLKTTASITFQKVRDFIFDLRPMMLDDLGVLPTIRRYVDSFREKNDIEVELEILGEERRMENHREVMMFRSIQELMGHVRDYASASHLAIRLDVSGSTTHIAVQDNGRGFNAEAMFVVDEGELDSRQKGLITLKERFELVKGTVAVQSNDTDGTLVRLELPVDG